MEHGSRRSELSGPVMSPVGEEQIFAEALQQAVRELRATTGVAMVPVGDAQTLGCAVVVGDPVPLTDGSADRRRRMASMFVERHDLRAVANVRRLLREQVRT